MPAEGITLKPRQEMLTFEEIYRLASVFVRLGIEKIRITGGEPMVRKNVEVLIENLARLEGVRTLAMTTNAVLLKGKVERLCSAGLNAINISLDTLQHRRFAEITLRDEFENVRTAIDEVLASSMPSIKLNVVVIAGRNEDELLDFVNLVKDTRMNVRFIEYMPFKDNQWQADGVYPFARMKEVIEEHYRLVPIAGQAGDVAKDFAIDGHLGKVSFVTSMTDSFCGTCNRLRVMADGGIKSCLFYAPEINVRDRMRAGASDEELEAMILHAVEAKPEAHPPMEELANSDNRAMVEIGG
jgi:cyclic pyranopterin phosphate synthase